MTRTWPALPRLAVAAAFLLALGFQSFFGDSLYNGDEVFSVYNAEPGKPLPELLSKRVGLDAHAPLFFVLLHVVMEATSLSDQDCFSVINWIAVMGAVGFVLWRLPPVRAAVAITLFLLGAPLLSFVEMGRPYAISMAACFALGALAGEAVYGDARKDDRLGLALLAALAAWCHIFAAVFAGAVSAAVVIAGVARKSRPLKVNGLLAGVASIGSLLSWYGPTATERMAATTYTAGWLSNDPGVLLMAFNEVVDFSVGPLPLLAFSILLCVGALALRATRIIATPFATFAALSFGLPLLVSFFVVPIISARYFAVFIPGLYAFLNAAVFSGAAILPSLQPQRLRGALSALAIGSLATPILFGPIEALKVRRAEWVWDPTAARMGLEHCAAPTLRVVLPTKDPPGSVPYAAYSMAYARLLGRPAVLQTQHDDWAEIVAMPCDVVGWAEFTPEVEVEDGPAISRALDSLRLRNDSGVSLSLVRNPRHAHGWTLLKSPMRDVEQGDGLSAD